MKGRVKILDYLPEFSLLTKHGAASPADISMITRECMALPSLTADDVIEHLYTLDIAEDKMAVFSAVIDEIQRRNHNAERQFLEG